MNPANTPASWGMSQAAESAGADTSTSGLTVVTSDAAGNTKGTWTELIASTAYDTAFVVAYLMGGNQNFLVDIGIGASGSEVVLIPNLHQTLGAPGLTTQNFCFSYSCPVAIPKGTRIAARCQDGTGARTIQVSLLLVAASPYLRGYQRVEMLNNSGSTVGGVDPGATANTKGSYSQLTASSSFTYKAIIPMVFAQSAAPAADATGLVDIAIGAAASEVVVLANIPYSVEASAANRLATALPLVPIMIPSGSRIAARAQCSTNDDTNQTRRARVGLWGFG